MIPEATFKQCIQCFMTLYQTLLHEIISPVQHKTYALPWQDNIADMKIPCDI